VGGEVVVTMVACAEPHRKRQSKRAPTLCPCPSAPPTRARLTPTPTSATCWSLSYGFSTGVERGRLLSRIGRHGVGSARKQTESIDDRSGWWDEARQCL